MFDSFADVAAFYGVGGYALCLLCATRSTPDGSTVALAAASLILPLVVAGAALVPS